MADKEPMVQLEARPFTLYSLRIVPLWDGDAERIELGSNLQEIVDTIIREKSVGSLIGKEIKPMRFCMIEKEEAIYLPGSQRTFYARERTSTWKLMVPASGIYNRETIMSCMDRSAGRNIEKYENLLFLYPKADEFYTFSSNEIRPVDDTVFVIEHRAR